MARGGGKRRTYARDNRGRFASTGATARGGRLKTAAGNKRKTVTARMAPAKAAGTIGKRKGLKASAKTVKQKQKPNVNKVALTKQGLQDRLLESTSKTYSNRANIRQTRNDKQIRSWKMAEYNKEGFYGTVSTQARRLKRAGMSEDAAWAKAFKERPRYSTKQKVRVNWGARNTQMLMS
jgi:hypothetical protein